MKELSLEQMERIQGEGSVKTAVDGACATLGIVGAIFPEIFAVPWVDAAGLGCVLWAYGRVIGVL